MSIHLARSWTLFRENLFFSLLLLEILRKVEFFQFEACNCVKFWVRNQPLTGLCDNVLQCELDDVIGIDGILHREVILIGWHDVCDENRNRNLYFPWLFGSFTCAGDGNLTTETAVFHRSPVTDHAALPEPGHFNGHFVEFEFADHA